MVEKEALFAAWREHLSALRSELLLAQGAARAGTRVDGDHRPENRGERAAVTTQGYLAAGIGVRLAALDEALDLLGRMPADPRPSVVMGAQVELEGPDGEGLRLALLPGGDGTEVLGHTVVSPDAPVAAALVGLGEDDEAVLVRSGLRAVWVVSAVQ